MKLWLVEPDDPNRRLGNYDYTVAAAETEDDAKRLHVPSGKLQALCLGDAKPGLGPCIIVAGYNQDY